MSFVVDASVAVKWFLPEIHTAAALRLLGRGQRLLAPDLLNAEFSNVLWKRVRRGDITFVEADTVLANFLTLPITIYPSGPWMRTALDLACSTGRTAYDSLYLALATANACPLVTADQRFFDALRHGPLATSLLWVEDLQ